MKPEKILEVVKIYQDLYRTVNVSPISYPHDRLLADKESGHNHCCGMLDEIVGFVREGRLEKSFRWLGFIQGFLWAAGAYTIDDLKNHNRPSDPVGKDS